MSVDDLPVYAMVAAVFLFAIARFAYIHGESLWSSLRLLFDSDDSPLDFADLPCPKCLREGALELIGALESGPEDHTQEWRCTHCNHTFRA